MEKEKKTKNDKKKKETLSNGKAIPAYKQKFSEKTLKALKGMSNEEREAVREPIMTRVLEVMDRIMELRSINRSDISRETGYARPTIDGFYSGISTPNLLFIALLSKSFSVCPEYIIDGTGPMFKSDRMSYYAGESEKEIESLKKKLANSEQLVTTLIAQRQAG